MNFVNLFPSKFKLVLLSSFFGGFAPISALYAILFESSLGFSIETISLLFAFWAGAYVLCEIPTGVLADYFSRKLTIGFGLILRGIGFGIWAIWPTVWGVAIGFALWAFSIACWSGAEEALLHDELGSIGKESLYPRLSGLKESIFLSGSVAGYIMASILQPYGFTLLCVVSAISSAVSGVIYISFQEAPRKKHETYLGTLKASLVIFFRSKILISSGVLLVIVHQIIGVLEEYQPRVFDSMGSSLTTVAILVAITNVISALLISRIDKFGIGNIRKKVLVALALCILYAFGLYVSGAIGIILVVVFNSGFLVLRMLFVQSLMKHTGSKEKATIGSIPGFMGGIIGIGMFAIVGFTSGRYGQSLSLGIYTVSLGIILVGYYYSARSRLTD